VPCWWSHHQRPLPSSCASRPPTLSVAGLFASTGIPVTCRSTRCRLARCRASEATHARDLSIGRRPRGGRSSCSAVRRAGSLLITHHARSRFDCRARCLSASTSSSSGAPRAAIRSSPPEPTHPDNRRSWTCALDKPPFQAVPE